MNSGISINMDWTNIQFKAKDIIQYIGYIIAGVFFATSLSNSIERQGEKLTDLQAQVSELKSEGKGNNKENQALLQTIQTQLAATNTQLRVLEQRVDMIERDRNK